MTELAAAKPQDGDLRIWWIPQVPMHPFRVPVDSLEEAALLLEVLAQYDLFQFEQKVKPDYSNAGGIETYCASEGEWEEADTWIREHVAELAESIPQSPR